MPGAARNGPVGPAGADGATGPAGAQGLQGPQGVQGAVGPQGSVGADGATGAQGPKGDTGAGVTDKGNFVSGNVGGYAANDVVSYNGASYVALVANDASSNPDAGAPWALFAAQGPQGLAGATGATGPAGPQGVPGDVGPQGSKGDTGATGPQGSQGAQGDAGSIGPMGPQGPTGPQGPKGDTGANGQGVTDKGNFVLNNVGGYVANDVVSFGSASYVAMQANAAGANPDSDPTNWAVFAAQGPKGDTGATGPAGAQGPAGPQGSTGADGAPGAAGAQGPIGPQGSAGPAGPQGTAGVDGKTVISGHGAPDGSVGADGDVYVDLNGGFLYGPKSSGAWDQGPNTTANMFGDTSPQTPFIGNNYELGTKFRVNASGQIKSIRFYKFLGDTGSPRVGHIWSLNGTLLATVTFGTETDSGWQVQDLPTPLTVTAGDIYTVSYNSVAVFGYTTNGLNMIPSVYPGSPLTALASLYDGPGGFPTTDDGTVAFFVDIVYSGPGAGLRGTTGPAGPTGATGATGPAGPTGPEGPAGPIGPQGPAGSQGPAGPTGPQGQAGTALLTSWCSGPGPSAAGRYYNLAEFGLSAQWDTTCRGTVTNNTPANTIGVPMSAGTLRNLAVNAGAVATNPVTFTLWTSAAGHPAATIAPANTFAINPTATVTVPIGSATCSGTTVTATVASGLPASFVAGALVNVTGLTADNVTAVAINSVNGNSFTYTKSGCAASNTAALTATTSGAMEQTSAVMRIVTTAPHGLTGTNYATTTGFAPARDSVTGALITIVSANVFTYPISGGTTGAIPTTLGVVTADTGSGAVATSSTVGQITTTTPHGFSVGESITVAGVANFAYFNTTSTVLSVPSPTTFTYTIAGGTAHAASGGGSASPAGSMFPTDITCTIPLGGKSCSDFTNSQVIGQGEQVILVGGPTAASEALSDVRVAFEKQ